MGEIVAASIKFALANYSLTFLVIGLVFAVVAIARRSSVATPPLMVEKLLAWHVFWVVGVNNLYNFIMHGFFGRMAAAFIGWADSPFQFEVATASLGFAVVGFIAAFRSFDMRLAAIVGPSIFTVGAAMGHIEQMLSAHNFAPGNAGVIFYMDMINPAVGMIFLYLQHRLGRPENVTRGVAAGPSESRPRPAALGR